MIPQSFLNSFTTSQLDGLVVEARAIAPQGKIPTYIPLLAQAEPNLVAVGIADIHKQIILAGDIHQTFPLMSVVKPLMLLYLLETVGEQRVFDLVDRSASEEPFNVIPSGKPRNPMLNAGAIAIASLLPSCEMLCDWLNQYAGTRLRMDREMLTSVRSLPHRRNQEIAQVLEDLGYIENAGLALDKYEQVCCLSATVEDCAQLGLLLACDRPAADQNQISGASRQLVTEILTNCGMYGASAQFAETVGLPAKSAVSGLILALIPNQGAIAVYSPTLDAIGNSVAGLFLLQKIYVTYIQ
jgi:glutaminase